ncbi:hypothetical protein BEI64_25975 [Eisenbergiella tayi]|nr:hypothetical protein BEI64_25975 [Eisenbergiella tayi]
MCGKCHFHRKRSENGIFSFPTACKRNFQQDNNCANVLLHRFVLDPDRFVLERKLMTGTSIIRKRTGGSNER